MEEKPITTKEKVKQMKGWENMPDELAEQIASTVRRLAELFYITIAREMSLAEFPVKEEGKLIPLHPEKTEKKKAA
jgi:hypothetical protein